MSIAAINMSRLLTSLDDLISTADNVARAKVSSSDREAVNQFSNLFHGNVSHISTGFFNTMTQHGGPSLTSNSSFNL